MQALALHRPILLGHSIGGMTAAAVAARNSRPLRGLVLVDPTFLSPERQREVYESDVAAQHRRALGLERSQLVAEARARHSGRSSEIIDIQVAARMKTSMSALELLAPPSPPYRDVVRAIDVPTLLVIGDNPVVTLGMASELRALNGHVRIEQIEHAGHALPFEQPERLARSVLSFLRELG